MYKVVVEIFDENDKTVFFDTGMCEGIYEIDVSLRRTGSAIETGEVYLDDDDTEDDD